MVLAGGIFALFDPSRRASSATARMRVARLPAYQVALWPDGWLLEPDGGVRVRDTHAMAEARRWHAVAERNGGGRARRSVSPVEMTRTMRMHGLCVPRAIIDMAGRRFPSEQVASVAVSLVASDWIGERRHALLASPERALAEQALAWSGSRHTGIPDPRSVERLLERLLVQCSDEDLLPPGARSRLACSHDDGYGLCCCRCSLELDLDASARERLHDLLTVALIPWNRSVVRDGSAIPLISLWLRPWRDRRRA